MAEDCIGNEGIREALKGCRRAGKIGELLPALLALTYRLKSGSPAVCVMTASWGLHSRVVCSVSTVPCPPH